jgi:uncharacterized membrane protein
MTLERRAVRKPRRVAGLFSFTCLYYFGVSGCETSLLLLFRERKTEIEMKPVKKAQPGRLMHVMHRQTSNDPEEVVVPSVAALIAILLTGLLYLVLPPNVIIGPNWLLVVIEGVFVIPLVIDLLTAWNFSHTARRILVLVPLGISTLALVVGVALFILTLPTDTHATNLLRSAALLWSFNILVFALWYWELDGGGPWKRHLSGHHAADFLFPQQANGKSWAPKFLDYLFVAFTGATALSPADTNPLTRLAKGLMMIEAVLSLTIVGILVARAVNILG